MELSLAGVKLSPPLPDSVAWANANIPVGRLVPYLDRAWPGSLMSARAVSFPSRPRAPRYVRLNTFSWPRGASRFAVGAYWATGDVVDPIRDAANGPDGATSTPIPLVMQVDNQLSGESLNVNVELLKIVPMTAFTADIRPDFLNAYILVVVDSRYTWQSTPLPAPGLGLPTYGASPSVTWLDAIPTAATALGLTVAAGEGDEGTGPPGTLYVDTIPADYLFPDPSLDMPGVSCGLFLDAIAWNTGLVFT